MELYAGTSFLVLGVQPYIRQTLRPVRFCFVVYGSGVYSYRILYLAEGAGFNYLFHTFLRTLWFLG